MYKVKCRYYASEDQSGESYVLTSDNAEFNTNLDIGDAVELIRASEQDESLNTANNSAMDQIISEVSADIGCWIDRAKKTGDNIPISMLVAWWNQLTEGIKHE